MNCQAAKAKLLTNFIKRDWRQDGWTIEDLTLSCPPFMLRALELADLHKFSEMYRDERIQQFIAPTLHLAAAERRFSLMCSANSQAKADKYYLAIADELGNALGMFAVFNFDPAQATAEIGLMLAKNAQGRGIARHALVAMLRHLQQCFQLTSIYSRIHPQNLATIKLAHQCQMRLVAQDEQLLTYILDEPLAHWSMVK